MPKIVWTRSMAGKSPNCLLGDDGILFHYTPGDSSASELICYDLTGNQLWSRPGWQVMLSLPEDRFLVNTPEGRPLVITGRGDILHRWSLGQVNEVKQHGDVLLLGNKKRVWVVDLQLQLIWEAAWPDQSSPVIDCYVGDAIYWVEGDHLRRFARGGRFDIVSRLPADLITAVMDEWEETTGQPARSGWYIRSGMSDFAQFKVGDRPSIFYWRVGFDAREGQFFLANSTGPHLILCLDQSFQPLWCKFIGYGCCGGLPIALPNGLYVTSSGCGGVLSWLDADGDILFRSEPHDGIGLATAYSNEVRVLPDGRCLVDGGPGVVAYNPSGDRLWVFGQSYSHYDCDPESQVLVGCYWQNDESNGPSHAHLECARGL